MREREVRERAAIPPGAISRLLVDLAREPAAPRAGALDAGAVIGRFEIVRELARGGFGVVYAARDRTLGRSVAFKLVPSAASGAADDRVLREAEAAARLTHPNIVTLFDVGRCAAGPYLVLELLRGETLAARLRRGPLPLREALRVAEAVARGLAHAHEAGVFHRDLSPGNVFLCEDGQVKVLDFGLAHAFGRPRTAGGTPQYMAPEQRRGAPEDERTDVFALGAILFEMLTGEQPFPSAAPGRTPRRAPALQVPDLPALADLLGRMLAADPVRRPRDGGAVVAALGALGAELDRSGVRPARRSRRRRPVAQVALALLAVAVLAGAVVAVARLRRAPAGVARGADRQLVAVADFVNDTGDAGLDALSGLLVTSLEQSQRIGVLPRSRMLDLARQGGRRGAGRIDEATGADAGARGGVRTLLVPSIRREGELYVATLRALSLPDREPVFTVEERAHGLAAVPALLDRLGARARRALREDDAEVEAHRVRLQDAVTSSLEAYGHYVRGLELSYDDFDAARALTEFRTALALDPRFALPSLEIAVLASWHEVPGEDGAARIAAAAAEADRLPDKERRTILAFRSFVDGDLAGAEVRFRALASDYPLDKGILYLAGEALWHGGAASGPREAAGLFRRALDLDPAFLVATIHLFQWTDRFGPPDEATARARRAVQARPGPAAFAMLARALAARGHLKAALASARRASSMASGASFEASYALAELLARAGRGEEAARELRRWTEPDAEPGDRRIASEFLPVLLATEGRLRAARRAWRRLSEQACGVECATFDAVLAAHLALASDDLPAALAALRAGTPRAEADGDRNAWLWALLGDTTTAAARAARLAPGSIAERRHAGAAALAAARPDEAVAILRPLAAQDPAIPTAFLLGLALAGARHDAEAVDAFAAVERAYPLYAPAWSASLRPRAAWESARALIRLGRRDEARAALDGLLARWARADRDLPLLRRARALRASLDSAGGGTPAPP
ncbi:serine/threonine protein kinase [Anaeromyxobacter dehalogenans 2CP-C]|uniref:Serine/threonine protein kinase n=1 Tax=Anaeromyxobacter dehalogenans (strain 2CP-C) TaxID=290397 RepID=Q2ILN6_ANADE|nr:serine/threonine protein kinase [Anaeromyxobacter dehalogenans 2CP-C]